MLEPNPIGSSIWYWAFYQGRSPNCSMELGNRIILSDSERKGQRQEGRP